MNGRFKLLKFLYASVLRRLILKAIDDEEKEWDDILIDILDNIFGYTG